MSFRNLLQEAGQDSLWDQCKRELMRVNEPNPVSVKEVDRLAVLMSKQVKEDYTLEIQKTVADTINGFVDHLPF